MIDQLIINDRASYDDFQANVKERTISAPKKKSIKETVPFSNVTYDFSAINGEVYWEERELTYVFEITAPTPAELEYKKMCFSRWIMNVMNENIYDPFDLDYHFVGTFSSINYDDDEGMEKTTITVSFTAYPYKVANAETNFIYTVAAGESKTVTIMNLSAHRITPTISASVGAVIGLDGVSYAFTAGETKDAVFMLPAGMNVLTLQSGENADCTIQISYVDEVF